ncbi:hypothetical protein J3A83DRAFT_4086152 [Scleroderma citrinum]
MWTLAEQDAFFRAIAVYSRWRPDLIAAAIPTRTVWDVDQYILALEEGLEDDEESDSDLEVEPAYEVSEAWIALEETLASHTIEEENLALLERHRGIVEEGAKEKRPRGRPRIHHGRRSRLRRRGARRVEPEEKRAREDDDAMEVKHADQPRKKHPRVTVSREDYMTHLDDAHLSVLDAILREGEESWRIENSREESGDPASETAVDDTLIDPELLAISGGPLISASIDDALSQSGPAAANEDPSCPNPDLLSPKSRRRLQKRLYMRRRRAKLQGRDSAQGPIETMNILERLKPGRKPKKAETPSAPVSDDESDDQQSAKPRHSGLTLPYKLREIFRELGVDAAYLRAQGMDLIHLGALARLRGCVVSCEEEAVPNAIDGTLVQHLQAALVVFVTDVIHRAIVWKERQMRVKRHSAAWRASEQQIAPNAVEHALETLGVRYHSHKAYFTELLSGSPLSNAESSPAKVADGTTREMEDPAAPALSAHRDIYTPLVRPPSVLGVHPLDCLSQTYMREATRRTDRQIEGDEQGSLMSDETDEEALDAELQEDEAVDEEDAERAEEYEAGLWADVCLGPCVES